MKITYDPETDIMDIKFSQGKYDVSEEIKEGIIIDLTKDGKIISIEILDASRKMLKEDIQNVTFGLATKAIKA